ncbi:ficolin-1-like [Bradysia coprophila]|uniref:ficolin-1-like n=1 Tax=Bradysia coprophila TaxID=38358 RepID=UPI00187DD4CD|nr:ficolin-1-like [Bradysia coprophila]
MNRILISALLVVGFIADSQAFREFSCEFKSDGIFEAKVEQSLLRLEEMPHTYFDDCDDALNKGFNKTGVYRIKPKASFRPFKVWCDMESDGGGWINIQTRFDGLVDFYRTWQEYRNGFGSVDSEHWLGNNYIHQITRNNDFELKIELTGFDEDEFATAKYSPFQIGTEDDKYRLNIGNFTGDGVITDSLSGHNGFMFTTKDNDNDIWPNNCADLAQGAWWYHRCYSSNLNGLWMSEERSKAVRGPQSNENVVGKIWSGAFNVGFYSLKSVEMKVRRIRS